MNQKCKICGDDEKTLSGDCFYCSWKGTVGAGALLKNIIKETNKGCDKDGYKNVS